MSDPIEDVTAQLQIEESRITINAEDREASVYVSAEDIQPLSENVPVATVTLAGEGLLAEFDLTAEQLDGVADKLYDIQEELQ